MVIGIDIDGVIFDTENYFKAYAELFDMDTINVGCHYCEQKIQDRYAWGRDHFGKFVDKYLLHVEENAPLLPACQEVLIRLKKDGHKLIIISSRGSLSPKEIDIANHRLALLGIEFDKIILNLRSKVETCLNEKVDFMIDDLKSNVLELAKAGIKCLYLNSDRDADIEQEKIYSVRNWGEIYRFIKCFKD